eukprot:4020913-Prymnesium_polylepis.1
MRPEATYLVWLDCAALGLGEEELGAFMLERARLILSGGGEFGPQYKQYQRINCACSRSKLEEAARRLERAVVELRRGRGGGAAGAT